jgi:hypothetical protein
MDGGGVTRHSTISMGSKGIDSNLRTFLVDGSSADVCLGGNGQDGDLLLFHSGASNIGITSTDKAMIWLTCKKAGKMFLRSRNGSVNDSIILDGANGSIIVKDKDAKPAFSLFSEGFVWNDHPVDWFAVGKHKDEEPKGSGKAGVAVIRNPKGDDSITLDGTKGDIVLANADCAEEFDISPSELGQIEPGTVMVLDDVGKLQASSQPYDKRVAGVISGGGDFRPGIVLDKKKITELESTFSYVR